MATLEPTQNIEALNKAFEESKEKPVLIFKHSLTCGTSAEALDELNAHLNQANDSVSYKLITVQSERDISNETATRLNLRHETPQAILIYDGRAIWHASHFRITAETIGNAVATVIKTQGSE